jgi:hypothetical protein
MSSPRLRASIFMAFTIAKTYGGNLLILPNCSGIASPFFSKNFFFNRAI